MDSERELPVLTPCVSKRLEARRIAGAVFGFALLVLLFCPALFALNPDWQVYQYGHRSWKIEDGFPGGFVNAVAQDGNGYLWIATNSGLFRFDGARFALWDAPAGGESFATPVFALLGDRDGSLWIGTGNGVSHWDRHRITHYEGGAVFAIIQDESGTVWFTSISLTTNSDYLCKVANSTLTCYGPKDGLPPTFVHPLAQDQAGNIWLGGTKAIIRWKDGSVGVSSPDALRNNESQSGIMGLAIDSDGSLLVAIGKSGPGMGLRRFRNGHLTTVTAPGFDGSSHRVSTLFFDKHHVLWIATLDEGFYRLHEGKVEHFTHADGLSSDFVTGFYEDHEGSIWVGTSGGLDHFRDLAVQSFSKTVYPKAVEFDNVVALRDGTLWVGGDSTLYSLRPGTTTFTRQAENLSGKQVTSIFEDRGGRIWIGLDNSLNLFSDGRFTPVRLSDGHPTGFIVSIAEDTEGGLWAVTTGPPRTILSIDRKTLLASPLPHPVDAGKIAGDPRGGLWIGTTGGDILHFSNGALTSFPFGRETRSWIAQLSVTSEGEVLAAAEFGLAWLKDRTVHVLNSSNGLPCSLINNFVFDAQGNLWLYAQCGLMEVSQSQFQRWRDDPSTRIEPRLFDSLDGLRTRFPPFEGAARTADGRLWFNSMESLQTVDPAHIHFNAVPPPVHIEAMRADFRDHALSEKLELPPLTRDIEISYSALSFAAPQKTRFRYRLAGFDQEWHDVGTRRQAVYMNLKPGTYTFQVIACNNDGVWNSAGDTLNFTILPKFYQTSWFLACVGGAALLLLCAVFVVRLRISTSLIEGRMNERLLERDRIARELHDTLLQGFQGIVLRLQGIAAMLAPSAPARHALEETMDRADQILVDGRGNLMQLRSRTSSAGTLTEQLTGVIADLKLQNDIPCELSVEGQARALKPAAHDELFAVAREALTNAFRHSKAAKIFVNLAFEDAQFSFRCRDNGVGLPAAVLKAGSAQGHWGLVGLRERAGNLHARLVVRNSEPGGAEIEIIVPARYAYPRHGIWSLKQLVPGLRD